MGDFEVYSLFIPTWQTGSEPQKPNCELLQASLSECSLVPKKLLLWAEYRPEEAY